MTSVAGILALPALLAALDDQLMWLPGMTSCCWLPGITDFAGCRFFKNWFLIAVVSDWVPGDTKASKAYKLQPGCNPLATRATSLYWGCN